MIRPILRQSVRERDLHSSDGRTTTFALPNDLAVCSPFASGPCVQMVMLVAPGEYQLSVLTKSAASNTVTLVVRTP